LQDQDVLDSMNPGKIRNPKISYFFLTYDTERQMKPEQIYQELKDLAEKLDIQVSEQNLRNAGIAVKSGLCKVKGQSMFIMDKHKTIRKKIKILASHLAEIPHENVFIVPAVRDLLEKEKRIED
jgi:hypothetical protein